MSEPSRLQGILFDFDDTLIDWSNFNGNWREKEREHLQGVLTYIQHEIYDLDITLDSLADDYMERTAEAWAEARGSLRAPNMPNILRQSLIQLGVPSDQIDMQECINAYNWAGIEDTVIFPDVPEILQLFVNHGIKLGIVTNASQPMSMRDKEVENHGLMPYFPHCRLAAADAGYLKPHPRIFELALEQLGTKPGETIFIGDSPVPDIAGAQDAGMKAILRRRVNAPKDYEGLIVPNATVDTFLELPSILDDWYPGW